MSTSLVWKSLQLFDAECGNTKGKKKAGNVKDRIHTKRHGVKKEIKRVKREDKKQKSTILGDKATLLPSLRRSALANQGQGSKDKTLENLEKLQQLSGNPALDLPKAEKIFERLTGNKILLVEKKEEDTETVFTEADFTKFAKNYSAD